MTPRPSTRELIAQAREAGYDVLDACQLRPNRWLLTLRDPRGSALLVLVQARPLITAADVQDLAELLRLRPVMQGLLLAYGGTFSPAARRTLAELAGSRLRAATALPPALLPSDSLPAGATPRPLR